MLILFNFLLYNIYDKPYSFWDIFKKLKKVVFFSSRDMGNFMTSYQLWGMYRKITASFQLLSWDVRVSSVFDINLLYYKWRKKKFWYRTCSQLDIPQLLSFFLHESASKDHANTIYTSSHTPPFFCSFIFHDCSSLAYSSYSLVSPSYLQET